MTFVTLHKEAPRFGRCATFFRIAVRLGMLRAVKFQPVIVLEDEIEAFVRGLTRQQIEQVNSVIHRSRNKKKKPPLAGRSKPGSKPGSGFVSQLNRSEELSMTAAPVGGTSRSTQ